MNNIYDKNYFFQFTFTFHKKVDPFCSSESIVKWTVFKHFYGKSTTRQNQILKACAFMRMSFKVYIRFSRFK